MSKPYRGTPGPADVPAAVYPCKTEACRESVTYSAGDLSWYPGDGEYEPGFYCFNCWDWMPLTADDVPEEHRPSLSEYLVVLDALS